MPVVKSIDVSFVLDDRKVINENDVNFQKEIISYFNEKSDYNQDDFSSKTNYILKDSQVFIVEKDDSDKILASQPIHKDKKVQKENIFKGISFSIDKSLFFDKNNDKTFCVIDVNFNNNSKSFVLICEYGDEDAIDRYISKILDLKTNITFTFKDNSKIEIKVNSNEVDKPKNTTKFAYKFYDYYSSLSQEQKNKLINSILSNLSSPNKNDNRFTLNLDVKPKAHAIVNGTNAEIWVDVFDYKNGFEVIKEIRKELGLSKNDEFTINDWKGFGSTFYKENMNEKDFDKVIESYELIQNSVFPIYVIEEFMEYMDSDNVGSVLSYMNKSYNGESNYMFKSQVQEKKISGLIKDLKDNELELKVLDSELTKSDKNHSQVIAGLMVDKRNDIKELKKEIIAAKNKLETIKKEAKELDTDSIKIDDGKTIFNFDSKKGQGRILEIGNPILRYNFFIVDLDSKKIISGSINKEKAELKASKINYVYPNLRLGVYNKTYTKNRLNLDVDTLKDYAGLSKKSLGGVIIGSLAVLTAGIGIYYMNKSSSKKKVHTKRGWKLDLKKRSKEKHELAYQKKKQSETERISEIVKAKPFSHPFDLLFTDDLVRMVTGGII